MIHRIRNVWEVAAHETVDNVTRAVTNETNCQLGEKVEQGIIIPIGYGCK